MGLIHAVLLGLRLVAEDEELQEAIRRELKNAVDSTAGDPRRSRGKTLGIEALAERRRKLLELLRRQAERRDLRRGGGPTQRPDPGVRRKQEERQVERSRLSEVAGKFEEVARILREMDVERLWAEATGLERRVLVEELLESVAMYPDHLEVTVSGAPRLNVTLEEVGLTGGWQFRGVGGGI